MFLRGSGLGAAYGVAYGAGNRKQNVKKQYSEHPAQQTEQISSANANVDKSGCAQKEGRDTQEIKQYFLKPTAFAFPYPVCGHCDVKQISDFHM